MFKGVLLSFYKKKKEKHSSLGRSASLFPKPNQIKKTAFDHLIEQSLLHRVKVLIIAGLLLLGGFVMVFQQNIDVLPNLNRPVVNVIIEAHGLAPEEVEKLISLPVEAALSGATGVTKVRSISKRGVALVTAEFDWGTDIYRNRQIVSEKLSTIENQIPKSINANIGPISSIMGEIQLIGLYSKDDQISLKEIRTLADWVLRKRLQTIKGVSNVTVLGGETKEYQVILDPVKMAWYNIDFDSALNYLDGIGLNSSGGFLQKDNKEFVIRNIGKLYGHEELSDSVIGYFAGIPVQVKQVADVKIGYKPKRGDAGVNGHPGVILGIQKQPEASTLELTKAIDAEIKTMKKQLPEGLTLVADLFKQAHFIDRSIENIFEAIRDGSIIVITILFFFLWNLRTTFITLLAIPLSLLLSLIILSLFGYSINTMTLGGFAIAIGLLVDDAIVDVENIFRRLKNFKNEGDKTILEIIYFASSEIRNSIVLATLVVLIVFFPLLFLPGVEGRIFRPLAVAFIVSLSASLLVALTITPVLSYYLLPSFTSRQTGESFLVRRLKKLQEQNLKRLIPRPIIPITCFLSLLVGSISITPFLGGELLPAFNEGTLTLEVISPAGISLDASVVKAKQIESICLNTKGVTHVSRRTGRPELDEHAEGVHYSEFDVSLDINLRKKSAIVNELREKVATLEDVAVNFGQPISHRLDHLLSGIKAQVAVFIYGDNLEKLLHSAYQVEGLIKNIKGTTDILTETQSYGPELKIAALPNEASKYGISTAQLTNTLDHALRGDIIGQKIEDEKIFDIRMVFNSKTRESITALEQLVLKHLPNGYPVRLAQVAEIYESKGPYEIKREQNRRRIAVQFNVAGSDLGSVVKATKTKLAKELKLPDEGFSYKLGGRHEAQERATLLLSGLGSLGLVFILLLLFNYFRSWLLSLQILLNIPFALIGAILLMHLFDVTLSLASIVGLISLAGIASRNGILMISHYLHLLREEQCDFSIETIIRGSQERLIPVLMTAITAILALLPIIITGSEASGKEILYPVAIVISGGLLSATLLDIVITPVIFYLIGKKTNVLKRLGLA